MPGITDIQTGHSASIAFGTTSWTANVTAINPGDVSREIIPTTYLGSSGAHTKIPGNLLQNGEWSLDFQYVVGLEPPVAQPAETITITAPDHGGTMSSAATIAGTGFISSWTPGTITTDELMTGTATIAWSGVVTYTSATS